MNSDHDYMRQALQMADANLGQTGKNPCVACLIVKGGHVVGQAVTALNGRPHAEALALKQAGEQACGATVYVTLEPCAHEGETPSCARLLAQAGVSRVVIACEDPDPRTKGQGVASLECADIEAVFGVMEEEALAINAGFIRRITAHKPFVSVKIATSLDGKMACSNGHSQWITGDQAREEGHRLRARHDAILTGSETLLSDNPQMTVRLTDYQGAQPRRFVLDRRGRCPSTSFTGLKTADIEATLTELAVTYQVNRLLIEAGPTLTRAILQTDFWDELHWFRAPILIGDDGLSPFPNNSLQNVNEAPRLHCLKREALGEDTLEVYSRRPKHAACEKEHQQKEYKHRRKFE